MASDNHSSLLEIDSLLEHAYKAAGIIGINPEDWTLRELLIAAKAKSKLHWMPFVYIMAAVGKALGINIDISASDDDSDFLQEDKKANWEKVRQLWRGQVKFVQAEHS